MLKTAQSLTPTEHARITRIRLGGERRTHWPVVALAVVLLIPPALVAPSLFSCRRPVHLVGPGWELLMGRVDSCVGINLLELTLPSGHTWSFALPRGWKYSVYFGPPIPTVGL
jgi:hypothetical protein